jgi:predicted RNase H-like nuclease
MADPAIHSLKGALDTSTRSTTFIGVDLAWSEKNPSGLAVARGSALRAELIELARIAQAFDAAAQWIADRSGDHCVAAIDAPLVVPNESGMRDCERELSSVFRGASAGTHSSNRARFADGGPPALSLALERHGFRHAVDLDLLRRPGRWMIEVYPHPALVRLFDLEVRLAYKKGTPEARRAGLVRLLGIVRSLERADPSLEPGGTGSTMAALDSMRSPKSIEDQLDAWLCSYIALYCCRWGKQGSRVFGTESTGYIVVPDTSLNLRPGEIE